MSSFEEKYTTDRRGNTITKAEAAERKQIEEDRAAAKARREAKAAAAAEPAAEATPAKPKGKLKPKIDPAVLAAAQKKQAAGGKLSAKEKRLLKKAAASGDLQPEPEVELCAPDVAAWKRPSIELIRRLEHFGVRFGADDEGSSAGGGGRGCDVIFPRLTITEPVDGRPLLREQDLKLVGGRRYGLVGPNGCGKSTLLRFLASGRLPLPEAVDVLLVEQEVEASDLPVVEQVLLADTARAQLLEEEANLTAEMESAESDESWDGAQWMAAVERLSAVSDELEACGSEAAESRVRRILGGLGFSAQMMEACSTRLSGGWRMRVALARALFVQPALLLLDEPTNHLDLDAAIWLEQHLATEHSGSLLVTSHDGGFLDGACTDIIELDCAELHYGPADTRRLLAGRAGRLANRQKAWEEECKRVKELVKGGLTKRKAEVKVLAQSDRSALLTKPVDYTVQFGFLADEDDSPSIAVLGAGFGYAGSAPLFSELRFNIGCHSRIALGGANGAGKSTLLRLLAGQLQPSGGEVDHHRNLKLGIYSQHFEETLPLHTTAADHLQQPPYSLPNAHEARKMLGMYGLPSAQHLLKMAELSGGQKARVALACIGASRPHILLLDEPTNHLDLETVEALVLAIRNFEGGVILASHDARLIEETECELWVCGEGDRGLRLEPGGLATYRKALCEAIDARAEVAARQVRANSERRRARREAAMAKRRR